MRAAYCYSFNSFLRSFYEGYGPFLHKKHSAGTCNP